MQIAELILLPCRYFFVDIRIDKKENGFLEAVWQFAVSGKELKDLSWKRKSLCFRNI